MPSAIHVNGICELLGVYIGVVDGHGIFLLGDFCILESIVLSSVVG